LEENEYDCVIPIDKPGVTVFRGEKEILNQVENVNHQISHENLKIANLVPLSLVNPVRLENSN
jgi:hypothetical protein